MLRRWLVCGTLVLLAALGSTFVVRGPASAASPFFQAAGRIDVEYFPEPTAAEGRILRALDERVSLHFRDASINDLAEYLREATGENVYVDVQELEEYEVDPEEPLFTSELYSIPLKTGLRLLLESYELAIVVQDGLLRITTLELAEELLITRVYPVSDLVAYGGAQDFDPLIELIENTLEVDSWDPVGSGTMQEFDATGVLVIHQTRSVHDQVLELLRGLRSSRHVSYGGGSYNGASASGPFFPTASRRATLPMMAR